jgi:uncharacterized membrane protein
MLPPTHPGPTDKQIDISIAAMLRFGVTLAAAVVLFGGLLYLRHPGRAMPDYSHFRDTGAALTTVSGIFLGAIHLDSFSIIQLGLLVLIATPVARVVFCVVGFARQRDRIYVPISALVLSILLYSLIKAGR